MLKVLEVVKCTKHCKTIGTPQKMKTILQFHTCPLHSVATDVDSGTKWVKDICEHSSHKPAQPPNSSYTVGQQSRSVPWRINLPVRPVNTLINDLLYFSKTLHVKPWYVQVNDSKMWQSEDGTLGTVFSTYSTMGFATCRTTWRFSTCSTLTCWFNDGEWGLSHPTVSPSHRPSSEMQHALLSEPLA